MKEVRDPAIKLFGKEITLLENGKTSSVSSDDSSGDEDGRPRDDRSSVMSACLEDEKVSRRGEEESEVEEEEKALEADDKEIMSILQDSQGGKPTKSKQGKPPPPFAEEPQNLEPLAESENNPQTPSIDEENASAKPPKSENDQSDTNNNQQKPLKKPDKILPCPRCNSMDTKFCYYNNYNVNQPRHFCKSCQRYWTAGGTTRNVPVGAGRRKNKNSASHCRHITIPEALQAARIDSPSGGIHHPTFKTNGTVLSFGPEAPLCKSMASVLNLAEKKAPNGGENLDDCSTGSSITTSNSMAEGVRNGLQEPPMRNLNGFSSQIPCLPGVPWPYPWNSAVPVPAFCPPGFPMPFYPPPYWNCSLPGAWSVPWFPMPPPTTNQKAPCSAPNSPTLGKHSREGDLLKPSNPEAKEPAEQQNTEGSILIPKTLRIDDPDEAARSSIWATLGIKNDSISRGGLFKAFQPKDAQKNHTLKTPSPALQANPAAFSRSLGFQERA